MAARLVPLMALSAVNVTPDICHIKMAIPRNVRLAQCGEILARNALLVMGVHSVKTVIGTSGLAALSLYGDCNKFSN